MEVTARRLGELAGETVESALAPGLNVLKTFDPPLSALEGATLEGARRRGKLLLLDFSGDLTLLVHLMSAGRMQLFDKRASMRDRTARLLLRLPGGRELRLREFGTKQAAWVKLLRRSDVASDDALAGLGPEPWPQAPGDLAERLAAAGARPLQ
jgi:formamidopyrimidine-DNA glycosylase